MAVEAQRGFANDPKSHSQWQSQDSNTRSVWYKGYALSTSPYGLSQGKVSVLAISHPCVPPAWLFPRANYTSSFHFPPLLTIAGETQLQCCEPKCNSHNAGWLITSEEPGLCLGCRAFTLLRWQPQSQAGQPDLPQLAVTLVCLYMKISASHWQSTQQTSKKASRASLMSLVLSHLDPIFLWQDLPKMHL